MSKVLATFSGCNGDILWSLPTVRQISKIHNAKVDMGIMPAYKSLLPLLQLQPYICTAFVVEDWVCTGSPCGDQPWQPPKRIEEHYEKVYHLTYRRHPYGNESLIDFIAWQQGLTLEEPVVPFISYGDVDISYVTNVSKGYIAYAFNESYAPEKQQFMDLVKTEVGRHWTLSAFINLNKDSFVNTPIPWIDSAAIIKNALCFIGCKSANYVLAHGVGQENIILYEPHPNRHSQGNFGQVFSNPHWKETTTPINSTPEQAAKIVLEYINQCLMNKEKENENAQAIPRRISRSAIDFDVESGSF